MHVAHFLSSLPKILELEKSQILASKDVPSLSEVFGRLRQATLSNSSTTTFPSSITDALPSNDKSAFATSIGSAKVVEKAEVMEVMSKGIGIHKCTYCYGKNHMADFYWEFYGKPSTEQPSFKAEEPTSQSLPPTSKVVSIRKSTIATCLCILILLGLAL